MSHSARAVWIKATSAPHLKLGLTTPGLSADLGMAKADCFEGVSRTYSTYGPLGGGVTFDWEGNWCGAHLGIGTPGVGMSVMETKKVDH